MLERCLDTQSAIEDDEAREALDRFQSVRRNPGRHPGITMVEFDTTIEYEMDLVWQLLLETQFMGEWLHRDNERYSFFCLPTRFHIGQRLSRNGHFLLEAAVGTYMKVNRFTFLNYSDAYTVPTYYTITITPFERFSTKISMRVERQHNRLSRVASLIWPVLDLVLGLVFDPMKKDLSLMREELLDEIRQALKRFEHFCWDRTQLGPLHRHYPGSWFSSYYDYRVQYYENRTGHLGPELGEYIREGERIGFLHPSDASGSLDSWKERNYLAPSEGFVAAIVKNHGDTVMKGDRILLTVREKDARLSVAELRLDYLLRAAGSERYGLRFVGFAVKAGQRISQGDTLATVVAYDKPDKPTVVLTSPYSGVVVAIGDFMDGQDLWAKEFTTVVSVDCSRATYPIEC